MRYVRVWRCKCEGVEVRECESVEEWRVWRCESVRVRVWRCEVMSVRVWRYGVWRCEGMEV